MRTIGRLCAVAAASALAGAAPAAADTLPGRDTPFRAAQAPADQYTTPTPVAPLDTPPAAQPSAGVPERGRPDGRERPARGERHEGGTAPHAEAPGVAGVDGSTTSPPPDARGTLPFTGGDLLALVWIALALLAAGAGAEIARRRLEARRA